MTDSKKTKNHDPKKGEPKADDLMKEAEEAQIKEPAKAEPEILKKAQDDKMRVGIENDLQTKALEESQKKVEELTNHLARCMADLQNYRRRSEEDKGRFVKFANAEMIKILLPALENLDRSCKHLPEALKEDAWAKGVLHTQAEITKAMDKIGVKRIETVGKKMDLKFHEVLMQGAGEKEMITEELDPGYTLNGETIKAAKVKVGDGSK